MSRSQYDDIHDKYDQIDTPKAGTRYERLVAIVQKALDEEAGVTHDVRLIGQDTQVRHQIDVSITRANSTRRILIECKDFDVSGDPVGLGTIRDFYGVVDDVKPDEAIVITCNRFTAEAMQYAKNKGIKLAILRAHRPDDDDGTIQEVHVLAKISIPFDYRTTIKFVDEEGKRTFSSGEVIDRTSSSTTLWETADRRTDIYFHPENGDRVQLVVAIDGLVRDPRFAGETLLTDGRRQKDVRLTGCHVQRGDADRIPINGFLISYDIHVERRQINVKAPIVALVLSPIGEGADLLIHDETLKRFKIDPLTGEARSISSRDSKRSDG